MFEDKTIYQQLEVLAATFPFDQVEITVKRKPEGVFSFHSYLPSDVDRGITYVFGFGDSPEEAAANLVNAAGDRDPEKARRKKIAELQMQIEKLQRISFLLPPYRAPNQIGYGVRAEEAGRAKPASEQTLTVESERTDVPF